MPIIRYARERDLFRAVRWRKADSRAREHIFGMAGALLTQAVAKEYNAVSFGDENGSFFY